MKEILLVLPFVKSSPLVAWTIEAYRDVEGVEIVGIDEGKDPLIGFSDIEFNVPGILNRLAQGEKEGRPAAILGCFGDPGIMAARHLVSIPVVGPAETAMAIASTLGSRFIIVVPSPDLVYVAERMAYSYGHADRLARVVPLDKVGAEACAGGSDKELRKTAEACLQTVKAVRADVIILGCLGFRWMAEGISRILKENGVFCPVIESGITAVAYTKMLLGLGLNQSREMWK